MYICNRLLRKGYIETNDLDYEGFFSLLQKTCSNNYYQWKSKTLLAEMYSES